MALGGGKWLTQNKKLPGAYINFVSASNASATLSDRGYLAIAMPLKWGKDKEIITVEAQDFIKNSKDIFGYAYTDDEMKPLRDIFKGAKTAYIYKLNTGVKASNTFAEALYVGTRGNDITIVIAENADDSTKFDVTTLVDDKEVDLQTVTDATELLANDWVTFKSTTLTATAGAPLTGGTDVEATGDSYQDFLNKIESYSFNVVACISTEETIKQLMSEWTKRLRDEQGIKFQLVVHDYAGDHEGIINLVNSCTDVNEPASSGVYWAAGQECSCAINKSLTNSKYTGEYTLNTSYTQTQLENCVADGQLVIHKVGDEERILSDVNSLVTTTEEKGEDFKYNQVIRVIDNLANDIANLFNTSYLGKVQNDKSGRVSLWTGIVKYCKQLNDIRAIEDFISDDVIVEKGDTKKSVIVNLEITPTCCMEQLYMTCVVS